LLSNPYNNNAAAKQFHESAHNLWVPLTELKDSINLFQQHEKSKRPRERDHALAHRKVQLNQIPPPLIRNVPENRQNHTTWMRTSPMSAVDAMFLATVQANPHLRPRVGNPDEMRSNRMIQTLEKLKFRVTNPEPGIPEDIHGAVITALNEEVVASAALGNKGGINFIHTYEGLRCQDAWNHPSRDHLCRRIP